MTLRIGFSAILLATASPALAAEPPKDSALLQGLRSCQQLQDSAARLACFDKAAAAIVGAANAGNIAVVDREQVRQVRRGLFGFALPEFPFFKGRKDKADVEEPRELVTTLVSLGSAGAGRYRFVIADGNAVWETTESIPLGDPGRGDRVTIQRGGFLGSYFAQIGSSRWVRVRRVR